MQSFAGNIQSPQLPNLPQQQGFGAFLGQIPGVQQWGSLGANVLPNAEAAFNQSFYNPYQNQALGGALGAADLGIGAAYNTYGAGNLLSNATLGGTLPYASNIAQTAFDPQQALYGRTLQQLQDQVRTGEAARGIATTPYGAGLESDALRNFNIDWQNQQLGRQKMGADALAQLYGTAGRGAQIGSGLMTQAPDTLFQTSMLPYSTFGGFGQNQSDALTRLLGFGATAQGLNQVPTSDWLSLMGAGNQQAQTQNQLFADQLRQSQLGWGQLGQLGSGLGSLAGQIPSIGRGLSSMFG